MRPLVSALIAFALLSAVLAFLWKPSDRSSAQDSASTAIAKPSSTSQASEPKGHVELRPQPERAQYEDLARMFEMGFAGGLVVDETTRSALESALDALSTPPTAQELAQLEKALNASLPYDTAQKINHLVRSYAAYSTELQAQTRLEDMAMPKDMAQVDASMNRIESLRRKHFDSATVDGLFGPHDRYARIGMEAAIVEADRSMPLDIKRERLTALRAALPEDQRAYILVP